MPIACALCGHLNRPENPYCEGCGAFDSLPEQSEHEAPAALVATGKAPRLLSGVTAPPFRRMKLGPEWDKGLGGGLPLPSSVLVSGVQGAGKSRLMARLCAAVAAKSDRPALYISAEMTEALVAEYFRGEGLPLDHVYVHETASAADGLAALRDIRPALCVVDSLSRLDVAWWPDWIFAARRARASVWAIAHVTADRGIAGGAGQQHDPDGVLWCTREGAEWRKCRFSEAKGLTKAE